MNEYASSEYQSASPEYQSTAQYRSNTNPRYRIGVCRGTCTTIKGCSCR